MSRHCVHTPLVAQLRDVGPQLTAARARLALGGHVSCNQRIPQPRESQLTQQHCAAAKSVTWHSTRNSSRRRCQQAHVSLRLCVHLRHVHDAAQLACLSKRSRWRACCPEHRSQRVLRHETRTYKRHTPAIPSHHGITATVPSCSYTRAEAAAQACTGPATNRTASATPQRTDGRSAIQAGPQTELPGSHSC